MLRGSARDHLQVGNLRQARQNLVLDSFGKVGIGPFLTPVFERQNGNGFFRNCHCLGNSLACLLGAPKYKPASARIETAAMPPTSSAFLVGLLLGGPLPV